LEAHAFQVVDEQCQIFALQIRNCTSIPFTAEEAPEALVELRRSSVETLELFQDLVCAHDGCLGGPVLKGLANLREGRRTDASPEPAGLSAKVLKDYITR